MSVYVLERVVSLSLLCWMNNRWVCLAHLKLQFLFYFSIHISCIYTGELDSSKVRCPPQSVSEWDASERDRLFRLSPLISPVCRKIYLIKLNICLQKSANYGLLLIFYLCLFSYPVFWIPTKIKMFYYCNAPLSKSMFKLASLVVVNYWSR